MLAIIEVRHCDNIRVILRYLRRNNGDKVLRAETAVNVSANNKCIMDGEMNHV